MPNPNYVLLYVDNPPVSAAFYTELLGKPPVDTSPTFVLFALESGVMLGLWSKHTVEPSASASFGGSELAFSAQDTDSLQSMYTRWCAQGLRIVQTPTDKEFGRTFVALDPDGHRLRAFTPTGQ
jgi:catechol 2,3-dioxygenase-like lactoylglutathione lyase family enzyme